MIFQQNLQYPNLRFLLNKDQLLEIKMGASGLLFTHQKVELLIEIWCVYLMPDVKLHSKWKGSFLALIDQSIVDKIVIYINEEIAKRKVKINSFQRYLNYIEIWIQLKFWLYLACCIQKVFKIIFIWESLKFGPLTDHHFTVVWWLRIDLSSYWYVWW